MTISYTIHPEQCYVHVIGVGQQTMGEMIAVVDALAEDLTFNPNYSVIFDISNGDYTAELKDGDEFVAALKRRMSDFKNKFALVVPPHLQVLAKLYSVLATVGGFDRMQCFLDIDQARQWCGIQD